VSHRWLLPPPAARRPGMHNKQRLVEATVVHVDFVFSVGLSEV
jgi:hypothetical protein